MFAVCFKIRIFVNIFPLLHFLLAHLCEISGISFTEGFRGIGPFCSFVFVINKALDSTHAAL